MSAVVRPRLPQDATEQTFVQALAAWPRGTGRRAGLLVPWMDRTAVRAVHDFQRTARRRATLPIPPDHPEPGPGRGPVSASRPGGCGPPSSACPRPCARPSRGATPPGCPRRPSARRWARRPAPCARTSCACSAPSWRRARRMRSDGRAGSPGEARHRGRSAAGGSSGRERARGRPPRRLRGRPRGAPTGAGAAARAALVQAHLRLVPRLARGHGGPPRLPRPGTDRSCGRNPAVGPVRKRTRAVPYGPGSASGSPNRANRSGPPKRTIDATWSAAIPSTSRPLARRTGREGSGT